MASANDEWVIQVQNQVKIKTDVQIVEDENHRWRRRSIYKLPPCVTNISRNPYTPQVVSFGPYHSKNENLKPMEEHKDRAVMHFLKRSSQVHLEDYFYSLKGIVNDLMDAYDSLDEDFKNNEYEFLKLMIRDGCFLLEIFRAAKGNFVGYASNDPWTPFVRKGMILYVIPHLKRDILMLENQLPMKVLHKLHQIQNGLASSNTFPNMIS
ncbi:hypothetical protein M9H77_09085 [Catharanthus roseus]|uniref:Uncharacterized protein n=1 Tax=Catharanthus roseus TaxID=4058 RepID=A0ACC0BZR7_CATRO|nr:hypothetical protein M9H77_09085 [Catharanthus roseus]